MKKLISLIVRIYRIIRNRDLPYFPTILVKKKSYGNKGAEWSICPDYLSKSPIIFSFGIGTDISFDLAMIEHHNARVIAFDPTPQSLQWLQNQELPQSFSYYPYGLSSADGKARFYIPANSNQISHSINKSIPDSENYIEVEMKSIQSLIQLTQNPVIDVLKMDIEGAEYEVIDQILGLEVPPRQLLIEFHHRFKSIGLDKTRDAVRKIVDKGYKISHISLIGEEYSFLLRDSKIR